MKTWKIGLLLLAFSSAWTGCDDDEDDNSFPGADQGASGTELSGVSFGIEAKTVLKNSGCLELPLVLDRKPGERVKVTLGIRESVAGETAREGLDFNLPEKVVEVPAGDTLAFARVDILDNGKADGDREFGVVITGVYGGGKASEDRQQCRVSVLSNAFVEFEKPAWRMFEASADASSDESVRNMRFVPLLVTGEVKEASTLVIGVKDSTASEYIHFTLKEHEVEVGPGTRKVMVEVLPVDDRDANLDRVFGLFIKEIRGGNLVQGRNSQSTQVTLVSEEIRKVVAFESDAALDLADTRQEIRLPVVIDKFTETPVKVRVAASSKSTAVAGRDYTIETPEVEIGSSGRAEVVVTVLDDREVDGDRKLILQLASVEGEYAYLADEGTSVDINIRNDDFPAFAGEVLDVEEDSEYALILSIPAVDREREIRFELEGNRFLEIPAAPLTVPAGADEVTIPVRALYSKDFPSGEQQAVLRLQEVAGFVLEEPLAVTLRYVPCAYRKKLGAWDFRIGSYDGNGKVFTDLVRTVEMVMHEWKKSYVLKCQLLVDWPCELVIRLDGDNALLMNDSPVYRGVGFGTWGTIDCYLKTAVQNDELWSSPFAPIPLEWDEATQTYTWVISAKFGLRSDCYRTGTKTKPAEWNGGDLLWFIMKDISMTKKQ